MENSSPNRSRQLAIRFLVLTLVIALTAYGWTSGRTIKKLQNDLDRAVTIAEEARRMAEANAMEAQRQAALAMQNSHRAEENFRLAEQRYNDCLNRKK
jgi:cell division protein FtsN